MADLEQLRAYYDNTDMSESIQRATREDEVADEIVVSTSIRLPSSVSASALAPLECLPPCCCGSGL